MSRKSSRAAQQHPDQPAGTGGSGIAVFLGIVVLLAFLGVAVAVRLSIGDEIRAGTVSFACWVTSCSAPGIALVGWLMVLTPLMYVGLMVAFFRAAPITGKAALVVLGGGLFLVMVNFLPGRQGPALDELLRGPGSEALATGMGWGMRTLLGAMAVGIALGAVSSKVSLSPWVYAGAFGVLGLVMVSFAMARAEPAQPAPADLFGPAVTVNGDLLTRTSLSERDGCDGILADADPLRGCLRTAEFGYTTSDSDAVIRFSAVMFVDNDGAWDAWGDIRGDAMPAGIDGDTIVVPEVTSEWLTIATVRHADRRAITEAEKPWLRWPAAQLRYAFAQAIGYSLATEPEPSVSVAPKS